MCRGRVVKALCPLCLRVKVVCTAGGGQGLAAVSGSGGVGVRNNPSPVSAADFRRFMGNPGRLESGDCFAAKNPLPQGAAGGLGQKQVCVPENGLQFRASLVNLIFVRRKDFLILFGGLVGCCWAGPQIIPPPPRGL